MGLAAISDGIRHYCVEIANLSNMKIYAPGAGETDEQWFANMANPHSWLMLADNLFKQAVVLNNRKGSEFITMTDGQGRRMRWDAVDRSMFLLAGFALENAIKAFLVYENPSWVADGKLDWKLRSHRLVKLKNRSKLIPMPIRSETMLSVFEDGLESWSRYPCGLTAELTDHQRWFTPELWASYCDLMRRYGGRLQKLLIKGWKGPHGQFGRWSFIGERFLDARQFNGP